MLKDEHQINRLISVKQRRQSNWLVVSYLAFFLFFQIFLHVPFRQPWWIQLLNVVGGWFYLPAPLLLAWVCLRQRLIASVFLLIPLLCFVLEYGNQFAPHASILSASQVETSGDHPVVRVMTWNVFFKNWDAQALIAEVKTHRPHLFATQELGSDYADELAAGLRQEYPYQALAPSPVPLGYGVFSRYPILTASPPELGHRSCRCQVLTIDFQGRPLHLINVHTQVPAFDPYEVGGFELPTYLDTAIQDVQITVLLQQIESIDGPLLVVGDFNTSDRQPNYRRMTARLHDAFLETGWGFGYTFPYGVKLGTLPLIPFMRLDYLFYTDHWQARTTKIGQARGADHRYLVGEFVMK